jgi:hypothetical protein
VANALGGWNLFPETQAMNPHIRMADSRDPRAIQILAKNIYREFRSNGFSEQDVMALSTELLALLTHEVRAQMPDDGGSGAA